ncbi:ARS binding protein 2-domain-containing protein [Gongronella butleri]|nr:ARS binding protein 2-domain-containing protein [Gongronella butleri]
MASPTAAIVTTSDLLADSLATDPPLQPVVIGLPTSDEELAMHKRHPSLRHLTINGSNVTPETFEDGYLQFILHHDPESLGDAVDSLVYTRRKFASVPKTGDLSYTTWDIFVLVNKLHNQEIKNWSQLVGQLGLSDMMGRPQFAQRVKRWMHKYKIDYYFDYLMGIPYDFHSDDEKYTGCLLMGNYQKRPTDYASDPHVKKRRRILYSANTATSTTMEVDDPQGTEERARRPVLLAGSRKRMRDASQSLVLAADDHHRRHDDELPLDHTVYNDQDETGDVDAPKSLDLADDKDGELDAEDQEHDFDHSAEDEEHHAISSATVTRRARASASSPSWQPDDANSTAKSSANTVRSLQAHLDDMNDQWATWKHHMDARHRDLQNQVAALIDEKEKNREQWANWRKKIANDLLSDPFS